MKFKTKSQVLEASTETRLRELIDASLAKRERLTLEKAPGHSLVVTGCDDDGFYLELQRGKKGHGWLAGPITIEETRDILTQYYAEPVLASGSIEKRGEWMEVSFFHPVICVTVFIVMVVLVWAFFFRH